MEERSFWIRAVFRLSHPDKSGLLSPKLRPKSKLDLPSKILAPRGYTIF